MHEPTGRYLCEQCYDAMTNDVIVKDGLEQAWCQRCRLPQPSRRSGGGWEMYHTAKADASLEAYERREMQEESQP